MSAIDRAAGAVLQPDRHDSAVGATTDRPVDTDEPGRAPEARPDEPAAARLAGEGAGGCGELDGGGGLHTPTIMTKGYPTVPRGSRSPGLGEPARFPQPRARGTACGSGAVEADVDEQLDVGGEVDHGGRVVDRRHELGQQIEVLGEA